MLLPSSFREDRHAITARRYVEALDALAQHLLDQFGVEWGAPDGVRDDVHRAAAHLALENVKVAVHAGGPRGPVAALWLVSANPRAAHILQAPHYVPPASVRDGVIKVHAVWKAGRKRSVAPYFSARWTPSNPDLPLARGVVRFLPGPHGPGRIEDERGRFFSLHRREARSAGLRAGDRVKFVATTDITSPRAWRWAVDVERVAAPRIRLAA